MMECPNCGRGSIVNKSGVCLWCGHPLEEQPTEREVKARRRLTATPKIRRIEK